MLKILEARVPGTDATVKQHPHEELGTGAVVDQGDGNVRRGDDIAQEAMQKKEEVKQRGPVSSVTHQYFLALTVGIQEELQRQKDETLEATGGAEMPADQGEAQAKKNGFMDKLRNTRVSRSAFDNNAR